MLKFIRNIMLAGFSAGWIMPILAAGDGAMIWMKIQETPSLLELYPDGPPFSYVEFVRLFFVVGMIWLGAVIAFWSFIASNKIFAKK